MQHIFGLFYIILNIHSMFLLISDYAKGFGGRYGVEVDRMDKVH